MSPVNEGAPQSTVLALGARNPASSPAVHDIPYTLYHGTFIHTPELNKLEICVNTLVGVNSKGVIDFVEKDVSSDTGSIVQYFRSKYDNFANIESSFKFVDTTETAQFYFPGFIDTHIHSSQYPNVGIGLDVQLLEWLTKYTFALENSFNSHNLDMARDIYTKVIRKTMSSGTTCASYFTTIDKETSKLFGDLLVEYGQRGFVGKVCMNHNDTYPDYEEPAHECLAAMSELDVYFKKINPKGEMLVKPIVTPRFAPVCSRNLLKQLGDFSVEHDLPIQTHISENHNEIELVQKMFPECKDYASVYDDHNLLQPSTILAHGVHLSDKECRLIKAKNCSISHCPTSNSFISSGEAPVRKYLYEHQINVALGTDISGGFDPSILSIVKHAILVSHHLSMKTGQDSDKLTLNEALYMATQGGAEAVGMPQTLGSFGVGKKFDAQLVDLHGAHGPTELFQWQIPHKSNDHEDLQLKYLNLVNKWVFTGDDRNCMKVYVNGRLVVDKTNDWVLVR